MNVMACLMPGWLRRRPGADAGSVDGGREPGEPPPPPGEGRTGVLVAAVVAAWCAAVVAATLTVPPRAGQLPLAVLLVAGSGVVVETTRRLGEPGGMARDVYAIFDVPCAILLGPWWALVAPLPRGAWIQLRVRRAMLHRRAYSAAATGLGYAAAAAAFRSSAGLLGPGGPGTGSRAVWWALLAAGCAVLRMSGDLLVLAAVKLSSPRTRVLRELTGGEAVRANASELALGTLAALAAAYCWVLLVLVAPLVWSMQAGVRHAELVRQATTDGKTGLLNDRAWRHTAAAEVERAQRDGTALAIAIFDVDHFKSVNDTHGHLAGDIVLAEVAAAARTAVRQRDVVGRVGGEEFAVVLPAAAAEVAADVAQRVRTAIPRAVTLPAQPGAAVPARVTVSVGIAAARGRPGWDLNDYLALADKALYEAKEHGRDAVWIIRAGDAGPWPAPPRAPGGVPAPR